MLCSVDGRILPVFDYMGKCMIELTCRLDLLNDILHEFRILCLSQTYPLQVYKIEE